MTQTVTKIATGLPQERVLCVFRKKNGFMFLGFVDAGRIRMYSIVKYYDPRDVESYQYVMNDKNGPIKIIKDNAQHLNPTI